MNVRKRVKPEDCYNLELLVGVTEEEVGSVPSEVYEMKIYGIVMNEQSGATNKLTLRQYTDTTKEKEWTFKLGAYDTIDLLNEKESPILNIPAGRTIKAIATAASIQLILSCYDT